MSIKKWFSPHARRRAGIATALTASAALLVTTLAAPASAHADVTPAGTRASVVLVHGAWADSGSWNAVVARLQRAGYPVDVFPTPLQSLSGDTSALRDYLDAIHGPIVLVGHSYGGAVVTDAATGNANVKALVYVDAFAPRQGQDVMDLPGPTSALADPSVFTLVPATPTPTATTELYVNPTAFVQDFANDLPARQGAVLAATQRPITVQALNEPSTAPGWASIPSWYEVGTIDKVIPPAVQTEMARSIGAHITLARTGHLPMVSDPAAVISLIEAAAHATH
jgi:pimeloyl-ACP methyl ester carboxylesterase